ncbi:MAG: lipoate--protein ligase [Lentisphaeria bacterium]|nr:lipoate--protein ligase [Lentisphaeria bacterium]
MRFFINNFTDPAFNLALEELLCRDFPEPVVMLWRNRASVIVGKNQNTLAEVNAAAVTEHKIQVVRRMTGGGAVFHDLGNINYTFTHHERCPGADSFARFAHPVVECLNSLGVPAEFSGINDILIDGRKVSGSAQCCIKNRTLFHGTLLFDADMEKLAGFLTPGKIKIESKGIKSVRARVANLKEFLPGLTVESFMEKLAEYLEHIAGKAENVPQEWIDKAEKLANERYRTWEWNFGSRFDCNWENAGRFSAGTVELKVQISDSVIKDIRITGDFFGSANEIEKILNGCTFRRSEIAKVLENIDLEQYISGLTKEEFLSLINF